MVHVPGGGVADDIPIRLFDHRVIAYALVVLWSILDAARGVVAHLHVGESKGFVEIVGQLKDVANSVVLEL